MFNIEKMTKANFSYNMDSRPQIEEQVLKQFASVIEESKEELEKILSMNHSPLSFERILQMIQENEVVFEYKKEIATKLLPNNFISVQFKTSVGNVYEEVDSDEDAFLAIINCMKCRDGLAMSVLEGNEYDVKHYFHLLAQKTLEICQIDTNLIEIIPYEECDDSLFDVRIYRFYQNGVTMKSQDATPYVYLENEDFLVEAQNNNNAQILRGNPEEVIARFNEYQPWVLSIYTHDLKLAYRVAQAVHAQNVLVNTSVSFAKKPRASSGDYLMLKHMIFERPSLI